MDYQSEVLFWVGIMRDHAIFQINAFPYTEEKFIKSSMYYRDYFNQKLNEIETTRDLENIIPGLLQEVQRFIEYKKMMLKTLLTNQLKMNMAPNLINHQINEAKEFEIILINPQKCLKNVMNLAGYIKKWMTDSSGHAAALQAFLDPSEAIIIEKNSYYKMMFEKVANKASELEIMINRIGMKPNALKLLAEEAVQWLEKYNDFLTKALEYISKNEVLRFGTLTTKLPDHMIREHLYFINNLKECLN